MKKFLLILCLGLTAEVFAQNSISNSQQKQNEAKDPQPLPQGFQDLNFGMSFSSLEESLKDHAFFLYEKSDSASFLEPVRENGKIVYKDIKNNVFLTAEGRGSIASGNFSFLNDQLYNIQIFFNKQQIDFYSIFRQLQDKYGPPKTITPQGAFWDNEEASLQIIKEPLNAQYQNKKAFDQLVGEQKDKKNMKGSNYAQTLDAL